MRTLTAEEAKKLNPMGLSPWGRIAQKSWEEFRPRMVAHLKKEGVYQEALEMAVSKATAMSAQLIRGGAEPYGAQSEAKMAYLLLPAENEMEILPPDLMPFSQPEQKGLLDDWDD